MRKEDAEIEEKEELNQFKRGLGETTSIKLKLPTC